MMFPGGGGGVETPLTKVTCPGWKGINSVGNSLKILSIFPDQVVTGKERGVHKLMRALSSSIICFVNIIILH